MFKPHTLQVIVQSIVTKKRKLGTSYNNENPAGRVSCPLSMSIYCNNSLTN